MSFIGILFLAIGGLMAVLLLWFMAPILSLVFDWIALLFRAIQLGPSWFRTVIWIFLANFIMLSAVTFFIAGDIVCLGKGGTGDVGKPYKITEGFGSGYIVATVAKLLPLDEGVLDRRTESAFSKYNIIKWFIGDSGVSAYDSPKWGTILTTAGDSDVEPKLKDSYKYSTDTVILYVPNGTSTNLYQFLSLGGKEVTPSGGVPRSVSIDFNICAVSRNNTQDSSYYLNGQCGIYVSSCAALSAPADPSAKFVTVGSFTYSFENLEVNTATGQSSWTVDVSGGGMFSGGTDGLEYKRAGLSPGQCSVQGCRGNTSNSVFGSLRSLNTSCFVDSCTYTDQNPRYLIKLPNGDRGCVEGKYIAINGSTTVSKGTVGLNPRRDFVENFEYTQEDVGGAIPGVEYVCTSEGQVDVRFLGLDINGVSLLYIAVSIFGVILLQRFIRNF